MIDIRSKYQMMHYLIMDIPFNNANDTFINVLKQNQKTSDFVNAFRVLISHYYQDLYKETSQEDQVNIIIPMMNNFSEYIEPFYDGYKLNVHKVISQFNDNESLVNSLSELIGIKSMIIAAQSYFRITTGKKSSKLRRLLYLINMIIIIFDDTKSDINIDNYESVNNSLTELLEMMDKYY